MSLTAPARRADTGKARTTGTHTASAGPATAGTAGSRTGTGSGSGSKKLYRVPEAMQLLSLSRSVIYNQIRVGRLRSVKEGSARLIPADAIAEYVALLEAEAEADR